VPGLWKTTQPSQNKRKIKFQKLGINYSNLSILVLAVKKDQQQNARSPAGVFHFTTNMSNRKEQEWNQRTAPASEGLSIPYSLARSLFPRLCSLFTLHSFTSSLFHFITFSLVVCPLSTASRDPDHGERKIPHFRGVVA